MTPTSFGEATHTLAGPIGWDEAKHGPCGGLPIWHGGDQYISCWRPSWRERFAILFGGPVWLSVFCNGHPPVALNAARRMFAPAK